MIGLNSITIYLGKRVIDFSYASQFLVGGAAGLAVRFGPLVLAAGSIAAAWIFLYFLYRKNVFLRVESRPQLSAAAALAVRLRNTNPSPINTTAATRLTTIARRPAFWKNRMPAARKRTTP